MKHKEIQTLDTSTPQGYKTVQTLLVNGLKELSKRKDIFEAAREEHKRESIITLDDLERPIRKG